MDIQLAQTQQIAHFMQTCALNLLDHSSEFSFKFDPITGEWELLNYETLGDGESDCFIKVGYTDAGFEFLIYSEEGEVLYEEPLQALSRLQSLMKDWRNQLHDKYKRDDRL